MRLGPPSGRQSGGFFIWGLQEVVWAIPGHFMRPGASPKTGPAMEGEIRVESPRFGSIRVDPIESGTKGISGLTSAKIPVGISDSSADSKKAGFSGTRRTSWKAHHSRLSAFRMRTTRAGGEAGPIASCSSDDFDGLLLAVTHSQHQEVAPLPAAPCHMQGQNPLADLFARLHACDARA